MQALKPMRVVLSAKKRGIGLFRKAQPSELWDLEDHLTRRRKEINYKYDSRGSRLTHVSPDLLVLVRNYFPCHDLLGKLAFRSGTLCRSGLPHAPPAAMSRQ